MQKLVLPIMLTFAILGCGSSEPIPSYLVGGGDIRSPLRPVPKPARHEESDPLKRCILAALANNAELAAEDWSVVSAQERQNAAEGRRLPTLEATGGYSHYLDPQQSLASQQFEDPGLYSESIFAGDLVLTMPIYTGGKISSLVSAAELDALAAKRKHSRKRAELITDVTKTFYSIISLRRQTAAVDAAVESLEEQRSDIETLAFGGKAEDSDLLLAETQLAQLQRQQQSTRKDLALQEEKMLLLLGLDDKENPRERLHEMVRGELKFQPVTGEIDDYLGQAYRLRSDYLAARAKVDAENRRVEAAKAGRWPDISLKMSYGDRWNEDFTEAKTTAATENMGRAGIAFNLPIFEGGQINARIREARANLFSAWESLQHRRKQIRLEVKTALLDLETAARNYELSREEMQQAEQKLDLERQQYQQGKTAVRSVLTAHSAYLKAQLANLQALTDHILAAEELEFAIGKRG